MVMSDLLQQASTWVRSPQLAKLNCSAPNKTHTLIQLTIFTTLIYKSERQLFCQGELR